MELSQFGYVKKQDYRAGFVKKKDHGLRKISTLLILDDLCHHGYSHNHV